MKIVFMGSPDFALPSLNALHASSHQILAVVSHPDKRRGRGGAAMPTVVKARALELGLPVIEVEDLKSPEFASQLEELGADLFVVVAFRVLPKHLLAIPAKGSVNLHASLLPKYRGAAPIHWAIINGEKETGCTVFFLDEKVDTGNIIAQKSTPVNENETTGDVYERLADMGSNLLIEALNNIESGNFRLTKQQDALATPAPKLFKEDCHINFNESASRVHNKIRGLSPFPTAWALWGDQKLNIYRSALSADESPGPGELFEKNKRLLVGCRDGVLELMEIQLPGTKRLSGQEFISGYEAKGKLK